jgi:cellulose synthase/poly-beta-1,6-N-acetylglucosamine synthase-like glycosyltransferase/DNA-binding NarL/FixJ family response regulator
VIRVLVADDQRAVREGVRTLLANEREIEIVGEAADASTALALARSLRPDLIVLDDSMPDLSSIEAARTIKAELPDTAVVFLARDQSFRDLALAAGATAFVLKDAPAEELLRALRASAAGVGVRQALNASRPEARRLVELLIGSRLMTQQQVEDAFATRGNGESFVQAIMRRGLVGQAELADILARATDTPLVSLAPYPEIGTPIDPTEDRLSSTRLVDPVDRDAARLLPVDVARGLGVLVTGSDRGHGVLAMSDPLDDAAFAEAERTSKLRLTRVTTTPDDIKDTFDRVWSHAGRGHVIWTGALLSKVYAAAVLAAIVGVGLVLFGLFVRDALAPRFGFSLFALLCGVIFFLYALKYYVTIASVLLITLFGDPAKFQGRHANGNGNGHANGTGLKATGEATRGIANGHHKEGYRTLRGEKLSESGTVVVDDPWERMGEIRLPADRQPFVSIHLALYNEGRVVDRLLEACTSFDYENYEVIVADDSTDETVEKLKEWKDHPRVRVIHRSSRKGFKGGALQEALRRMNPRTEYVMVFDADFVPPADAIWHFLDYFGRLTKPKNANGNGHDVHAKTGGAPQNGDRLAVVQGYQWHMLNASENWITKGVRAEFSGSYVLERAGQELFGAMKMISGSVYMIRADVLRKLGWSTSITEDWELTIRLYLAGYKVLYTPYIQAPAECVSKVRQLVKQRMRWAEGHTYNVKKYFWPILRSPNLSWQEKLEFVYYAPYYLQSVLFSVATVAWIIGVLILGQKLPMWGEAFGWSLVVSNALALPLMNLTGVLLEGSLKRDALGLVSFIGLSWILVPFQAYASIKALFEKKEGGWVRTPKSGRVTESLGERFHLARLMPWELPRRKRGQGKAASGTTRAVTAAVLVLGAAGIITVGALSMRAAATSGGATETDLAIPALIGTAVPLAVLALGWLRMRRRVVAIALAFTLGLGTNVLYLAHAVPAAAVTDNTSSFTLARTTDFATPNLDMKQNYTPSGQAAAYVTRTTQTATATAATSITVNPGYSFSGVQIAWVSWRGAVTISGPTDGNWNLVRSITDPTNTVTSAMWIRAVTTNGNSNIGFTSSAAGDATLMVQEYSGVDLQSPIDVESGQSTAACGSPCTLAAPSVTTTQKNDIVVTHHTAACGGTAPLWTAPAGMTTRYDIATTSTLATLGADVAQGSTGASGVKTATVSCGAGTAVGVTDTLALRGRSTTCPAIQYRSSTTNSAAAATTLTLNVPAGVQNGDVMIASLSTNAGSLVSISGWNALATNATKAVFFRFASNEPASYTFTDGAVSTNWAGIIDAYSGADTNSQPDVTATLATGTTAAVTWTSITSATDQALGVTVSFENNNVDTIVPPALYTPRSAQGGAAFIRTSTRWIAPAGAIAPTSADTNATTSWGAINIALKPATALGSPTILPTSYNWTCKFSSDQMSANQTMNAGTVLTNLYLDNAPAASGTSGGSPTSLRASATAGTSGTANLITANKPAGTLASDVLLAYFAFRGGTGVTDASITEPAGWTRIDRRDDGTSLGLIVYWKTNAGAETTYQWSWSGTAQKAALIIGSYIGVDTTNPIDAHVVTDTGADASGNFTVPGITTTYEYEMRVGGNFVANNAGCASFWYPTATSASSSGNSAASNVSGNLTQSTGAMVNLGAGPTGAISVFSCGTAVGVLHHLALKPIARTCTVSGTLFHTYTPQYRSTSSAALNATGTDFAIAAPSGLAANDVLLASIAYSGGTNVTTLRACGTTSGCGSADASWVLVHSPVLNSSTTIGLAVWRHVGLVGDAGATFHWTVSPAQSVAGVISDYYNVDTTTPIDVEAGLATSAAAESTANVTTTAPDRMLVSVFSISGNATWSSISLTDRIQTKNTSGTIISLEQSDGVQQGAGASGAKNATASAGTTGVVEVFALRGKAATSMGSISRAVTSPTTGPALFTNSFTTSSGEVFNANDRFELDVTVPNDSSNCGVALYFDSSAYASQVTMATIVPEGVAGLLLLAPALPFGARWWKRRRP